MVGRRRNGYYKNEIANSGKQAMFSSERQIKHFDMTRSIKNQTNAKTTSMCNIMTYTMAGAHSCTQAQPNLYTHLLHEHPRPFSLHQYLAHEPVYGI
jgi:hypothetical protein